MTDLCKHKILLKPILHGRPICSFANGNLGTPLPEVSCPSDLKILTVLDKKSDTNASINWVNNPSFSIEKIYVSPYVKWVSKIDSLYKYINKHYDLLPEYIMYLDASDTVIINDIPDIKPLLSFYKCKALFNSEYGYWHTGFASPKGTSGYYDPLYLSIKSQYFKLTKSKYGFKDLVQASLNAGAFVGEKDYILNLLLKTLNIMNDDPAKNFPYGCQDDQCVLKYLHFKDYENTSIDIFHKLFFWGTSRSLEDATNASSPDYFYQLENSYKNYSL
tara:strand:+ start:653 stop:1477 length:825 start_codon:yes stop_codon:yes gene_type:complete